MIQKFEVLCVTCQKVILFNAINQSAKLLAYLLHTSIPRLLQIFWSFFECYVFLYVKSTYYYFKKLFFRSLFTVVLFTTSCFYNTLHQIRKCKIAFYFVKCTKNFSDLETIFCDNNTSHDLSTRDTLPIAENCNKT